MKKNAKRLLQCAGVAYGLAVVLYDRKRRRTANGQLRFTTPTYRLSAPGEIGALPRLPATPRPTVPPPHARLTPPVQRREEPVRRSPYTQRPPWLPINAPNYVQRPW